MGTSVFVNLAVKDVKRSIAFFSALGFTFDPRFTNDDAAGMIIEEGHSYAMLLSEAHFKTFIKTSIADATKTTEVLVALSCPSRQAVDEMMNKAIAAGGKDVREPQELPFMYGRAFADPDGHVWEPFWMDLNAVPAKEGA